MKTLTGLAIFACAAVFVAATSNTEPVRDSVRNDGAVVAPYHRPPANGIPSDNASRQEYSSQEPDRVLTSLLPSPDTDTHGSELFDVKAATLISPQLTGSSVRIGDVTFHDFSTSAGGDISGTSIAVGDITFHDLTSSDGRDISGTSIGVDDITFHDFTTSDGEDISGTSIALGDVSFHDLSTSEGDDISGTTIRIGGIEFHDFTTSDGDSISGETITIGDTSFTTLDE